VATLTGSATEPAGTLTAPTVGGDTDTWGTILNDTTLTSLLGYALWLKTRVPAVAPTLEADGRILKVASGVLVFGDETAGGSAAWGGITGTLANQTDLQTALDGKAATSHTHTLANITDAGTAAAAATTDFATAAQGTLADSAVQPGDPVSINAQTGTTYTLALADAGKLVTLDNAAAITLTVPTNASVAFEVGTVIALQQLGAGAVSVAGAAGVTVNGIAPGSAALTSAQYLTTAALTQHASDTWTLTGAVATS
jgi:hypothetical protein